MPEAVLAGPNGGPAIDAMTGMPLTMEELLRRRGIMSTGGVVSPFAAAPVAHVDPNAANAAINAASAAPVVSPATDYGAAAQDVSSIPVAPIDANAAAAIPPEDDGFNIWPWLAGGGAAAAAAYAARRFRRNPTSTEAAAESVDEARRNVHFSREPIDAEFEEVDRNDMRGSNRRLGKNIDGMNVAQAGEIGAGPKALSGTAPVVDTSNDQSLTRAMATNRSRTALPDYNTRAPVSTRMQNAARQANNSRTHPTGETPIRLPDTYSDLTETELATARQLASRIRSDRVAGQAARDRGVRTAGRGAGLPAPAPVYDQGSELAEAVALVRRLRTTGVNTSNILPLVRRIR